MKNEKRCLAAINLTCIRQEKTLFTHLSFSVDPGKVILLEGPNGSGKSSLLRLVTGLAFPPAGEVRWEGKPIQKARSAYWENIHYLGHTNGLKLGLTVLENLQLTNSISSTFNVSKTDYFLECLQLSQHKHLPATYLSAGQKRRLALVTLFLVSKPLWILDEPLTALDTLTQQFFLTQLKSHVQNGGLGIISSHQANFFKNIPQQVVRLNTC